MHKSREKLGLEFASKATYNAIIFIDGKVPLLQRTKDGEIWWDLPGGKPDMVGESPAHVLTRELREELGIEATVDRMIGTQKHPHAIGRHRLFYKCTHISGAPENKLPDEHLKLELVDPAEAVKRLGTRIPGSVKNLLLDNAASITSITALPQQPQRPFTPESLEM